MVNKLFHIRKLILMLACIMALPVMIAHADTPAPAQNGTHEPMNTEVRSVDKVNVLFQYGEPVPSFDTWRTEEESRDLLPLDGEWKFAYDPDNAGLAQGWHNPSFDDSAWKGEQVPGSWDLYDTPSFSGYDGSQYGTGSAFYDGYAWYRTRFKSESGWNNKFVKLNFLGVNYSASVYVNGTLVGEHEGGQTPFALDVGAQLRPGQENVIAVRVYRRPWYDTYTGSKQTAVKSDTEVPYQPVDYWPYAGLTRSVYLEATSPVTVSKLLTVAKDHVLETHAVLYNHGDKKETRLLAVDPGDGTGGRVATQLVTLAPGETKVVSMAFPIPNARTWDVATPQLYKATASLYKGEGQGQLNDGKSSLDDRLSAEYGMRTIEVKDGKLQLNGRPILLKGVNWHEETDASGRSMTIAEYDKELGAVLDLNANFIRNSVYNRHPYVYEFADSHGLLVMDDIDNMWLNAKQEKLQTESYGLSRALALTMAWNQANHPSVIMWSLQNESDIWTDRVVYHSWLADMKQAVKSLDLQNRPVTWASGSSWDPAFDIADVIGFNEYFGYFYGKDSDLGSTLDTVHKQYPNKPILITENGTWSFYGNRGPDTQSGTEDWQSAKFTSHWNQVTARANYMAGYTYWVLKDYKERMSYNHEYNGISEMGMMTFDEKKRMVYDTFKNAVNPQP